jgi:hypothetical protein
MIKSEVREFFAETSHLIAPVACRIAANESIVDNLEVPLRVSFSPSPIVLLPRNNLANWGVMPTSLATLPQGTAQLLSDVQRARCSLSDIPRSPVMGLALEAGSSN